MATKKSKTRPLGEVLASIDALLSNVDPKAASTMKRPATAAALGKLAKKVFAGGTVPEEVEAFFRWHDGQSKPKSLDGETNRTPLSIAESIDAWTFLSDPAEEILQPWKKTWLPLFTNGAGDYLVYESAGKKAGSLIGYWHDDKARKAEHQNLLAWATATEAALTTQAKKQAKAPKRGFSIDHSASKWKKSRPPTRAMLKNLPIGATYSFRKRYFMQPAPWFVTYVKVGNDQWYYAMHRGGTVAALDKIVVIANSKRPPMDFEWKKSSVDLASNDLTKKNIETDLADGWGKAKGWPTDHVGLFEGLVEVTSC